MASERTPSGRSRALPRATPAGATRSPSRPDPARTSLVSAEREVAGAREAQNETDPRWTAEQQAAAERLRAMMAREAERTRRTVALTFGADAVAELAARRRRAAMHAVEGDDA